MFFNRVNGKCQFEFYSLSHKVTYTPVRFHKSSQKIQSGQWYHIAVTAKAYGMRKFYVNGIKCGPDENVLGLAPLCREMSFGSVRQPKGNYNPQLYGKPFNGAIAEPALFGRELSPDEVMRLSNTVSNNQVLR